MRRRSLVRLARRLLALGLGLGVVASGELAARLFGVQPAYQETALGAWRLTADLVDQLAGGGAHGHAFRMSTNADGLRTRLPREKTPGRPRVALQGDSTVFGWGVEDGESVGDAAQAVLDPGRVDVLNAGQPGHSSTLAARLHTQVVSQYKPDLTILFVSLHDTNRVLVSDREAQAGGATPGARLRVWLARSSRLYVLLRRGVFQLADRPFLLPGEETGEPRVPRVSDTERTLALDEMRAAAAVWGGEVAVGYLPFLADATEPVVAPRLTDPWVADVTRGGAVRFIDLRGCCVGAPDFVLPDDPGHLSPEGNRRAGEALARALEPWVEERLGR